MRSVAVYAVPDDRVGDRVMVAVEVDDVDAFDVESSTSSCWRSATSDPKWVPRFVRRDAELPKLASMKIDKTRLRRDAWTAPGVWWRPARGEPLRPMTHDDAAAAAHLLP